MPKRYVKVRPTIKYVDVVEDGQVVRKTEWITRDYTVPFTPQDGFETQIGDLATMVKSNLQIEHTACYLSRTSTANPFDLQVLSNRLNKVADNFDTEIKNEKQNPKKD